ncbi:cation:proton antiporter [Martelella endophytica]|uniref:cation:proton antiporter domain-containing protein n=1 Tax=Martelella endophytica TaxID=1486262 RepID=UPI0009E4D014|nr:cation:proton antiporter [Martelella endophytica]
MDLAILIAISAGIIAVIGLSEPLAGRLNLPYTVILAAMGIAIGVGATFLWQTNLTNALNPLALAILNLPIRASFFLNVLLPLLVFQVALNIDIRRMLDDWVPILVLAVLAVVVAMLAVGFALYPVAHLPLAACLLIGAIVSTTDPSAVVSIFKATPSPQRLARIVEGESLLNDAAAIALFALFLGFVTVNEADPKIGEALGSFPWIAGAGALAGILIGRAAVEIIARMPTFPRGQMSISIAIPPLTYILAEYLSASGVIAVVAAGLTINLHMTARFTPALNALLRDTWDLLAHWAGSLIFILAAILIPKLLSDFEPFDLLLIGLVVGAALVARAVILFGLLPLLTLLKLSPKIEAPYCAAILWGGLRGAVTLALALAVTENSNVPGDIRHQVGLLATGFTLFTLIVQGTTLRWIIAKLKLDQLSPLDIALSNQVIAVALQSVRERVAETARDLALTREIVRDEAKRFAERLDKAVEQTDTTEQLQDRDRVTLGLVALAAHERDTVLEAYHDQIISANLAERLVIGADHIIEATRTSGRAGYRAAGRRTYITGKGFRAATLLHNYLGIGRPMARMVEDRFEVLVSYGMILPQLTMFIDDRILRIHGRRVAELLHELLNRRLDETRQELERLRLQFPGYAEDLERRLIRRTTLQLEEREYDALTEDGLIGPELRATLGTDIEKRRAQLNNRPVLDLKRQVADIIMDFPAFTDFDDRERKLLRRRVRTVYAAPGQQILRRESSAREVWYIASGTVNVITDGVRIRMTDGHIFGQFSVLAKRRRPIQVSAITDCTLLTLDEHTFRRFLSREGAFRRAVIESAAKRGVILPPEIFDMPPEDMTASVRAILIQSGSLRLKNLKANKALAADENAGSSAAAE